MNDDLRGKVALITGGNRGIGRGIALEFASRGCAVMLTARDSDALAGVADEVGALGAKAATFATDLTKSGSPATVIQETQREFGRLDILVNNAGGAKRGHIFALKDEDWADGFGLKFFAHVALCREAWPLLKESGGSVVAISGIGARAPVADYAIGSSVIGASIAYMKALADIGKHDGVQVNTVNPGSVRTDRMKHRLEIIKARLGVDEATALEHHRRDLDITRFGLPEDVAALVAFIVSPRGRWMHGSAVDIDGGQVTPLRMSIYD